MDDIVCKFGGASLADAAQIRKAADILKTDRRRRKVVVSAAGGKPKITDLLRTAIASTKCGTPEALDQCRGALDLIRDRRLRIVQELGLIDVVNVHDFMDDIEHGLAAGSFAHVESRGEYMMAKIMAAYLGWQFVDATELIRFDDHKFCAEVSYDIIRERLGGAMYAVIPGYYGMSFSNKIVLFERDGSDISGAIIARGIGAILYENWKEVPGFLNAQPAFIPEAKTIPLMTHAELRELAAAGAAAMHPAAIAPVLEADVPVMVRNASDPDGPFTKVVPSADHRRGYAIGVAGKGDFSLVKLSNVGAYDAIGFMHTVTGILLGFGIPFHHSPGGFDYVNLMIDGSKLNGSGIDAIIDAFREKLPACKVRASRIARVALIGEGMAGVPGTLGVVATALGKAGINIKAVDQGDEELSVILFVQEESLARAIRVLFETCVEQQT